MGQWKAAYYDAIEAYLLRSIEATLKDPELGPEHLKSTHNLWRADYWTRLWILQEVVLARSVVFLLGPVVLAWHTLRKLTWHLFSPAPSNHPLCEYVIPLIQLRHDHERGIKTAKNLGLLCLTEGIKRSCSLPHDAIYALLPLASESSLIVDYSLPIEVVIRNVLCLDLHAFPRQVERYHKFINTLAQRFHFQQDETLDPSIRWGPPIPKV